MLVAYRDTSFNAHPIIAFVGLKIILTKQVNKLGCLKYQVEAIRQLLFRNPFSCS